MNLPAVFGKYHLLEKIAIGGMAEVFLAKSFGVAGFERLLVIKKILPHMAENEEFITMFIDEARIAASLTHSNIAQITELGREQGDFFIAMEFVHGKDLSRILEQLRREGRCMPMPLAALVSSRICEGLDYAHRKRDADGLNLNIVHRDVSPSNVLISYEGEVKLIDFGIARAQNRLGQTSAGALKGKFGYMSPEQARGLPVDRRSDIFTVGILLYEMVCGERLFGSEGGISTLEKVRTAEIVPPSTHNRDIPPELETVIMRALSREEDRRFQWASEMQDQLAPFLLEGGTLITAKHLATFMRGNFTEQMREETERQALYRRRGYPWIDQAMKERTGPAAGAPDAIPQTSPAETERAPVSTGGEEVGQGHTPWPQPAASRPALRHTAGARTGSRPRLAPLSGAPARQESAPARDRPTRRKTGTEAIRGRPLPPERAAGKKSAFSLLLPFFAGLGVAVAAAVVALLVFSRERAPETPAGPRPIVPPVEAREKALPDSPPAPEVATAKGEEVSGIELDLTGETDNKGGQPEPKEPSPPAGSAEPEKEVSGQPPAEAKENIKPPAGPTPEKAPEKAPEVEKVAAERPAVVEKAAAPKSPTVEKPAGAKPASPAGAQTASRDNHAQLAVNSEPAGAEVLLNGKLSGRTPLVLNQLDAGTNYFLVLKLDGYKSFMKGVKFGQERQVKVDAKLVPRAAAEPAATGFMVANTTPWARVIVDGRDTGLWTPIPPAKKIELSAGSHKILFRTQDDRELEVEVNIEPGKVAKIIQKIP